MVTLNKKDLYVDMEERIKYCPRCKTWLSFNNFYRCKKGAGGFSSLCKKHEKERRIENRDKKIFKETKKVQQINAVNAKALDFFYKIYEEISTVFCKKLEEISPKEMEYIKYINENPAILGFLFEIKNKTIRIRKIPEK